MADNLACAEAMVAAYNAQDFAAMERQIAADVDFAHFNRNFVLTSRDELIGVLRQFASDSFVERRFEAPERVIASGERVTRGQPTRATAVARSASVRGTPRSTAAASACQRGWIVGSKRVLAAWTAPTRVRHSRSSNGGASRWPSRFRRASDELGWYSEKTDSNRRISAIASPARRGASGCDRRSVTRAPRAMPVST